MLMLLWEVSNKENLENIKETAKYFIKNKREFIFDAEHFFDGYKNNKENALEVINKPTTREQDGWFYVILTVELYLMKLQILFQSFKVNTWKEFRYSCA